MIKACFFDIDGTLLSHKSGAMSVSTAECLKELQRKGIKIVICTGRFLEEMKQLPLGDISFDAYLTLNGQLCYDKDYQMFAGTPIPESEVEVLVSMFETEKIPLLLIGKNGRVLNFVNQTVVDTQNATMGRIPEVGKYNGEPIYQICSYVPEEKKKLLKSFLDECDITSWNETGIDIVAKGSGKDVGIQRCIDRMGLRRSEIIAFGDGENDIPMLKFAGIGVAMGNAEPAVKSGADYVTAGVDDDGIQKALQHFGLIGQPKNLFLTKVLDNRTLTLHFDGRLDSVSAPEVYEHIGELLGDAEKVVFDFSCLEYITSYGLRVLIAARKIMNGRGEMRITGVNPAVYEILDMTGFSAFVSVEEI